MGNILKKPMEAEPQEDFEALTVLYDCELCHSQFSTSLKFTDNCSHTICENCISNHIDSKLEIHAIEIICPAPECKAILDPVLCRNIVDDQPYQQWLDRLCCNTIAGRKKCYCPYTNCRALIIDECSGPRSFATKSKCPECRKWVCFSCQTSWHEGKACDASKRRVTISLNDMLFMGMVGGEKKKLTCCPKCRSYTELVPKLGYCIVQCRCKTVYCFHCERTVKRLRCNCEGFKNEITDYNRIIIVKSSFILVLIGAALWIWITNVYQKSDLYF